MEIREREVVEYAIIEQYISGHLSLSEVCDRLSVSRSTVWRKSKKVIESGPLGLVHGLRGQPSNHKRSDELKESICSLYEEQYMPYGYSTAHFYQEALESKTPIVSYPTVLRWLKSAKLVSNQRKGQKHRSRRVRKASFGEMLQMDTSIHDWLDWGENLALISNIDDATGHICSAYLNPRDTTLGNLHVIKDTILNYGLFGSLYVDRAAIFKTTRTGFGKVRSPKQKVYAKTQVGRALDDLGIHMIYAYSPQAKGRIERNYRNWQTRLIPELRKNQIQRIEEANQYIKEVYIPKENQRFAKDPSQFPSVFVPVKEQINLDYCLAEKYDLTITNDHILSSSRGQFKLKVLPSKHRCSYAKAKVTVYKHTDFTISVIYKNEKLKFEQVT